MPPSGTASAPLNQGKWCLALGDSSYGHGHSCTLAEFNPKMPLVIKRYGSNPDNPNLTITLFDVQRKTGNGPSIVDFAELEKQYGYQAIPHGRAFRILNHNGDELFRCLLDERMPGMPLVIPTAL